MTYTATCPHCGETIQCDPAPEDSEWVAIGVCACGTELLVSLYEEWRFPKEGKA